MILNNEFIKTILSAKRYGDMRRKSKENTQPITQIINMISPDLDVKNYTFLRLWQDFSFFVLTSDLDMAYTYILKKLWQEDKVYAFDNIEPIYNRLDGYSQKSKEIYQQMVQRRGGYLPIVIEYDLGRSKDCHCFLLGVKAEDYNHQELFDQLFDTVLYFYRQFRQSNFKHDRIQYFSKELMRKEYLHYSLCHKFSPYDALKDTYDLTSKNIEYIKLIALGISASQIAETVNRSLRTVEKSIDAIRYKLALENRQQLDVFLQMFYKSKVKEHLLLKKMY